MSILSERKVSVLTLILLVSFGVITTLIIARTPSSLSLSATLTPPEAHGTPTGYTLEDVWSKVHDNTYAVEDGTHAGAPTGAPGTVTLHTVSEIYNAIPTLDPATIKCGATVMGVSGTYNCP